MLAGQMVSRMAFSMADLRVLNLAGLKDEKQVEATVGLMAGP